MCVHLADFESQRRLSLLVHQDPAMYNVYTVMYSILKGFLIFIYLFGGEKNTLNLDYVVQQHFCNLTKLFISSYNCWTWAAIKYERA